MRLEWFRLQRAALVRVAGAWSSRAMARLRCSNAPVASDRGLFALQPEVALCELCVARCL